MKQKKLITMMKKEEIDYMEQEIERLNVYSPPDGTPVRNT